MNKELLEILLRLKAEKLIKNGVPFEEATKIASESLKEEIEKAEFSAYCGEHDC